MKHLPDGEIKMFYRQAKDKPYQVIILADLCLVSVETMVKKLTELGFKDVVAREIPEITEDVVVKYWSDDDVRYLKDEYEERGTPLWEIAQALGRTEGAVRSMKGKLGLKRKYKNEEFEWRSLLNVHLL